MNPPGKKTYIIDGANFSTLQEFYDEVSRSLIPDAQWGHNLDAFNDILRGGFGTPPDGFILEWKNSELSKQRLGYPETIRQLELRLERADSSNHAQIRAELEQAKRGKGRTVFDWLIEIIEIHCRGGAEEVDGIELQLE